MNTFSFNLFKFSHALSCFKLCKLNYPFFIVKYFFSSAKLLTCQTLKINVHSCCKHQRWLFMDRPVFRLCCDIFVIKQSSFCPLIYIRSCISSSSTHLSSSRPRSVQYNIPHVIFVKQQNAQP